MRDQVLEISERRVNDVVILKLSGPLLLVNFSPFQTRVRELLASGARKLLLDLSDVPYFDSAGIGALVGTHLGFSQSGGALKICGLTERGLTSFKVQKIDRLFEIYITEADALSSFSPTNVIGGQRYLSCPSCGSPVRPGWGGEVPGFQPWEQTCPKCDAQFALKAQQDERGRISICRVRVQTYEQEYFEVVSGPPYTLRVVGRLDLFSSSALDKVWRAIPKPRRVIVDLGQATDIDSPGAGAVRIFLGKKEPGAKAAISLEGLNHELASKFPAAPDVYPHMKSALVALGDVSDTALWLAEIVEQIS